MEILPFLYLGSAYHAARRDMLDALGITALLNVSSDCPNHFEGHYQYKCIPVEDNHKADISSWFMEAIEYIGRLPSLGVAEGTPRERWVGISGTVQARTLPLYGCNCYHQIFDAKQLKGGTDSGFQFKKDVVAYSGDNLVPGV